MKRDEIEREARRALEPLRYSPVVVSSYKEIKAAREATLPQLASMIEGVPHERAKRFARRRARRLAPYAVGGSVAIAAALLLWVRSEDKAAQAMAPEPPQLTLVAGQLSQKGTPLAAGVKYSIDSLGRLSTSASSGAKFMTNEGVRIGFASDSSADLSFAGEMRRIALNRGKIQLSVPKLKRGTSLSVATPDAIVTVHGTRFSVEIAGNETCVRVIEGVVSVVRGADYETLTKGQHSGCAPRASAEPLPEPETSSEPRTEPVSAAKPRPQAARSAGTLTLENRLFRSALAAEQSGQSQRAEALAKRLLARYPDSLMAPEARSILRRLQERRSRATKSQ